MNVVSNSDWTTKAMVKANRDLLLCQKKSNNKLYLWFKKKKINLKKSKLRLKNLT